MIKCAFSRADLTKEDVDALIDEFRNRGRFDESKEMVKPTWKCCIFRQ